MSAHRLCVGDHRGVTRGQGASPCPGTGLLPAKPTRVGPRCPRRDCPWGARATAGLGSACLGSGMEAGGQQERQGGKQGWKQGGIQRSMKGGEVSRGQRGSWGSRQGGRLLTGGRRAGAGRGQAGGCRGRGSRTRPCSPAVPSAAGGPCRWAAWR